MSGDPSKTEVNKSILLSSDTKIVRGRLTKIFARFKLNENEQQRENLSFSIVNNEDKGKLWLDLEGTSEIEVEIFITQLQVYLRMVIDEKKKKDEKQASLTQENKSGVSADIL